MGVFDQIVVSTDRVTPVAEFARVIGPIEDGYFDPSDHVTWVLSQQPTFAGAIGFGVDGGGQPYYDTAGPDEGEGADMWVNGVDETIWLEGGPA